ncbi:Hydrogenase-4 component B [Phycisphaerae bacterium RAS1]|nr:Hydrogenase-4 component B [Phycisphaerae bacterium RAS1]
MTAILASLAVLVGGATLSALLWRMPRVALLVAMFSISCASVLCLAAGLPCLLQDGDAPVTTVHWPMPLGEARLALDGLSAWFLVTIALVSVAVAIYSWAYLQAEIGRAPVPSLGAFLCVLVAALILVVTADDAALFLFAWELMMLGSFFLILFHHRQEEVRRAAWVYLIANHLGTALFVLPLFGMLVAAAGTTNLHAFRAALQGADPGASTVLFLLGLLGFGTKAGLMPMHVWLPVAHPAAPSPVSALLSGVVIKAGIYGLLRLLGWLPSLPTGCAVVMLLFAMVSGVLGVLYALAQHDIKRLLAYHSVENIGIIGLGIGMGMLGQTLGLPALVALGYGAALLHVLNHALFKGLLFLSAGAVIHATGTGDIERLGGLSRRTPVNAALFLVAAISICGLPPFNGFVSEWILYGSLFGGAMNTSRWSAGMAAMAAMSLALMGGLALACFAKVFSVVFLGQPRDATLPAHPTPRAMCVGMMIPALLCIGIGVLPGVFVPLTAAGVGAVSGLNGGEFARSTQSTLAPATQLSMLAAVLLAGVAALAITRRTLLRRNLAEPAPAGATWGCGFSWPSARMQYSASSFAWPLIQSLRHLIWPDRKLAAPTGTFAGHAQLETHTPDMAEHDFFAPLLGGVSRAFRMVRTVSWTGEPALESEPGVAPGRVGPLRTLATGMVAALRQGRIHMYMAFLVLTLLVVFCIESLSSHGSEAGAAGSATQTVDGVSK